MSSSVLRSSLVICLVCLLASACASSRGGRVHTPAPTREQSRAAVETIRDAAIAASGRVDLAVIAVDNAMAAIREAEIAAVEALRRHGDGGLDAAFRGLLAAMDAGRSAWGDTVAIADRADALRRLSDRARAALVRLDADPEGQGSGEAAAIAAAASEAERLAREVEAATLDLKRRWLLPLPSADAPSAPSAERKPDGLSVARP